MRDSKCLFQFDYRENVMRISACDNASLTVNEMFQTWAGICDKLN